MLAFPAAFVVVVVGFLSRIQRESPDSFGRVYVDVSAVVVKELERELPILHRIFQVLGAAANLKLNIQRCHHPALLCTRGRAQQVTCRGRAGVWEQDV